MLVTEFIALVKTRLQACLTVQFIVDKLREEIAEFIISLLFAKHDVHYFSDGVVSLRYMVAGSLA